MTGEPIYVEILIRAPMEELWRCTQTPDIHVRWDLRFTDIEYLPKTAPDEPQRFRYATRFGPFTIAGEGITAGDREQPGRRTSALQFASGDRKSLIEHGSGYWQYTQTDEGVCFVTLYSYEPRWGRAGAVIDRLIFRRLLGWATAWSFDRLRLWLEREIDPALALRSSLVHAAARLSLAAVWIYQGAVPKLLYPDTGEIDILRAAGLSDAAARRVVALTGVAEIGAGVATIALWNRREVFPAGAAVLTLLAGGALARQPAVFRAPFNPGSLTVAALALSAIGALAARDLPSSRHCLRTNPRGAS